MNWLCKRGLHNHGGPVKTKGAWVYFECFREDCRERWAHRRPGMSGPRDQQWLDGGGWTDTSKLRPPCSILSWASPLRDDGYCKGEGPEKPIGTVVVRRDDLETILGDLTDWQGHSEQKERLERALEQ